MSTEREQDTAGRSPEQLLPPGPSGPMDKTIVEDALGVGLAIVIGVGLALAVLHWISS